MPSIATSHNANQAFCTGHAHVIVIAIYVSYTNVRSSVASGLPRCDPVWLSSMLSETGDSDSDRDSVSLSVTVRRCDGARRCATVCDGVRRCATVCDGVRRCATVCDGVRRCVTVCDGVRRCATVCDGVWRCVTVCDGVWRCVTVGQVSVCVAVPVAVSGRCPLMSAARSRRPHPVHVGRYSIEALVFTPAGAANTQASFSSLIDL